MARYENPALESDPFYIVYSILLSWLALLAVALAIRHWEISLGFAAVFALPTLAGCVAWAFSPRQGFRWSWFGIVFGLQFCLAALTPSLSTSRLCSNQWATAAACKGYAEAQEIYRRTDYDGDGVLEYSQRLRGNDSLLERSAGSGDLALIERSFAAAAGPSSIATPKAGYFFKILKAQGKHAPGGAKSYVDFYGNMTRGYALIAVPAVWDQTGRDSFMINNNGTIYSADLGPNTAVLFASMTEFNPTPGTWIPSE